MKLSLHLERGVRYIEHAICRPESPMEIFIFIRI